MSDLISRQAVLDICRQGVIPEESSGWLIYESIKQLPSAQQWIPCSERLPEEQDEFQITWTTSAATGSAIGVAEYEVTTVYDYKYECELIEGGWLLPDYMKNYPDVRVIAWMPLPEPYKAESEVEE